ncbi:MAG: hypothetical protein WC538_00050 [Thermoanaerobaculia bacterium]|jgi:hypothetical protein
MPRRVLERATPEDDAAVRALLRRTPMEGDIRLTFEREPDAALSATVEGERHHVFVAREADGAVTGLCSRAVRRVWVNGSLARVGYLGQLRSERAAASIRHTIEAGFAACRASRLDDELPFDYTSIMADNATARRFLERGVRGLPRYVPLGGFRTLLVPVASRRASSAPSGLTIERGAAVGAAPIASFLQAQYRAYQLAPVWTEGDLLSNEATRDLSLDDFVVAMREGVIVGGAALWDQSEYRQSVVRGYAPWLGRVRGIANAWYSMTGQPRLPAVGERLRIATISHFAVIDDDPAVAIALIDRIRNTAVARKLELLVLGLAESRPLVPALRNRLRARILGSILYGVLYDGEESTGLDARPLHVEVATL